ncbi:profilin [Nostoc sp. UHCC 0302]
MKKLSSFILVVLLFISTLFFVSPNAFAISDYQKGIDQMFQKQGFNQGVLFATDENNELFTPSISHTSGFNISNSEIKTLITLFKNPQSAYSSGIVINNIKYVPIEASSEAIFGTKDGVERATSGVVAVKIDADRIVVGIYDDPSFDLDNASFRDFLVFSLKSEYN